MLLLCLETSCDETAAAVVRDGRRILSSIVASQVEVHARYGGVVPEIASRKHVEAIIPVLEEALDRAAVSLDQIEGLVVTRGPGLIGALLVGLTTAKAIALARNLPVVGVHHIEGHILAIQLEREIPFPYMALAVSGGHTHLYQVDGIGCYRILGQTLDDAAGEAFDKVAKLIGLGYPGGARIDRLAAAGNPRAITFPRPLLHKRGCDFSFSGIKTAVLHHLQARTSVLSEADLADLAASFQAAMVEVLTTKTLRAAEATGLERIVVAGGVACNSGLRKALGDAGPANGRQVFFPSPALCADNAAMLAVAGEAYLQAGQAASSDLNAVASWALDRAGLAPG
jgi:N6-L-threonylcarbamoyladenine synthase